MISQRLEEAINAQINAEMWSAYLYLSMSAYCQEAGLPGMANWFAIQFKEEQDHAQIFFNYLVSRGGRVLLKAIDAVETEWESPLAAFENTYAPGYTTEKIMDAFASGCVPIYYGDPLVVQDFNPDSFINAHDFK